MAYRRTERVIARLAARQEAIIAAARALAAESGMAAVQIVPVAERAGIAAGTVYRYFPSKDDLVAALVGATAEREIAAIRGAAAAAPGPLSALAAAIMAFAAQHAAGATARLGDARGSARRRRRRRALGVPARPRERVRDLDRALRSRPVICPIKSRRSRPPPSSAPRWNASSARCPGPGGTRRGARRRAGACPVRIAGARRRRCTRAGAGDIGDQRSVISDQ